MIVGTLPAVPTPLTSDLAVDVRALEKLLTGMLDAGVEGAVLLGTSGEGIALDKGRRTDVLRNVSQFGKEGVLIAGCAGNSVREVALQTEVAADHGFDAVLVPPPYYYLLSDDALVEFFGELEAASPLPMILYHIPQLTKTSLSIDSVRQLAELPGVVGIKDSGGQSMFHFELLASNTSDFSVLQGFAPMVAWSYLLGAQGAITPVSALFPRIELELRAALEASDLEGFQERADLMCQAARLFRAGGQSLVTNLKAVGELASLFERWTEPPTPVADDTQLELLGRAFRTLSDWALAAPRE